MLDATTPANHIQCEAGDGPVRRGEAVIRSNGRRQIGWHRDCYTLHRATKNLVAPELATGRPLTERLAALSPR